MKMRSLKFVSVVSVGTLLASCADNSENQYWEGNESMVVVTRVAGFDGSGQTLEGENEVTDMQACLFEGGIMTKAYKNLQVAGDTYRLQVDGYGGNLYMLANASGVIDLEQLQSEKHFGGGLVEVCLQDGWNRGDPFLFYRDVGSECREAGCRSTSHDFEAWCGSF